MGAQFSGNTWMARKSMKALGLTRFLPDTPREAPMAQGRQLAVLLGTVALALIALKAWLHRLPSVGNMVGDAKQ